MSPEVVTATAAVIVATVGAVGSVMAAWVARQARNNTQPISNGFAKDTLGRLDRIEGLIIAHIASHATHDLTNTKER